MFDLSTTTHWSFWIVFSILGLFIIWLFFGGKKQEFIGLEPLLPLYENIDNNVCYDKINVEEICEEIENPKPIKWKRQEICCKAIEKLTGKKFNRQVRSLPWLVNPETKKHLELDCYNDELKLGLEHNGEHHYNFPNSFNKTKEEWINMVRRDQLKIDLCDNNGVYLITVPYTVEEDKIEEYINSHLQPYLNNIS